MMDKEQLLAEIREANLTYLMLAQRLITQDRVEAIYRLGVSEETADIIAALSSAQVLKIASGNTLLCHMRSTDETVWQLLTNHNLKKVGNETTSRLHAQILMAGRFAETL
jgi:flagellar transcriptional activator FlhD